MCITKFHDETGSSSADSMCFGAKRACLFIYFCFCAGEAVVRKKHIVSKERRARKLILGD